MKVFCHIPREGWIVDRMGKEYCNHSMFDVSTDNIFPDVSIIWLMASWCWNQIPKQILEDKKVLCTIHHEVPWKFDENRKRNFILRDKYVDVYHTYTEETKNLIQSISNKPVHVIPHWVNSKIWSCLDKDESRKKLCLPNNKFIIGSFQRDTEGSDLITPKLEKGPDIFLKAVKQISESKDVHVLLGGWRRQFVIKGLSELNIPFTYIEMAPQEKVNLMYNSCDMYIVGSRCEGGPQSLFECGITKTPCISSRVGQAELLLKKDQIFDIVNNEIPKLNIKTDTQYNFEEVKKYYDHRHIELYDKLIRDIVNENN